ncbi:hypothetical protein MRX96_049117 [Rhipicephalus microplus]
MAACPTVCWQSLRALAPAKEEVYRRKKEQPLPPVKGTTPAPPTDARSDLLAAIREGIKLRRVEDFKQKQVEKAAQPHDVASILARRVAIEVSDSESGSDSEYDSDWDNETEC